MAQIGRTVVERRGGEQQGVTAGHEAGDRGVARGSARAQVVRFVDDYERTRRRVFAHHPRGRPIGEFRGGRTIGAREAMHGVQAHMRQLRMDDRGAPHGLQGGGRDDMHLFVRTRHGERRVRLPEAHVVGEERTVMRADGGVNAGHGFALVREQRDVSQFSRWQRGDERTGKVGLHVARIVERPRHGVYHSSKGVRRRSGTS